MPKGRYLICAACGQAWQAALSISGGTSLINFVRGDGNNSGYAGIAINYIDVASSATVSARPSQSTSYLVAAIVKLS